MRTGAGVCVCPVQRHAQTVRVPHAAWPASRDTSSTVPVATITVYMCIRFSTSICRDQMILSSWYHCWLHCLCLMQPWIIASKWINRSFVKNNEGTLSLHLVCKSCPCQQFCNTRYAKLFLCKPGRGLCSQWAPQSKNLLTIARRRCNSEKLYYFLTCTGKLLACDWITTCTSSLFSLLDCREGR